MAGKDSYIQLIEFLKKKRWTNSLEEVNRLLSENNNIHLRLVKIFCLIEIGRFSNALSELEIVKKTNRNRFIDTTEKYILDVSETTKRENNPLYEFIDSFTKYHEITFSFPEGKQLDELLNFLINKPYIK